MFLLFYFMLHCKLYCLVRIKLGLNGCVRSWGGNGGGDLEVTHRPSRCGILPLPPAKHTPRWALISPAGGQPIL